MLEAVPNVSEGRDASAILAIGRELASHARLLDVHSDADHHRTVYSLVGEPAELVASLVSGVAAACELIDLRLHEGVHPRVGAADVVPLVYLHAGDAELARGAALEVAARIGEEIGLPVFLYGDVGAGRRPALFRRGGLAALDRRVAAGELVPEFGPARVGQRSGAVLVGARKPLVAYNVDLATDELELAREIAAAVRESSGGIAGVQAIGLRLPQSGRVQVSMNLLDLERAALHDVVAAVASEAAARGIAVAGGELVGLVPESVLQAARAAGVQVAGVDESRVLERLAGSSRY
ncbi:MAG: glutamate formimidoyltransferase [Actinobacteria bacterium]|nr:glutamate formimidoyltransferase [Actinomycetota bacterium]